MTRNNYFTTALHDASKKGTSTNRSILLEHGEFDVNARDKLPSSTALHLASERRATSNVADVPEHGA